MVSKFPILFFKFLFTAFVLTRFFNTINLEKILGLLDQRTQ